MGGCWEKNNKKLKDIGISQKRCGLMKVGSRENRGSLGGEGVIKNRRAF